MVLGYVLEGTSHDYRWSRKPIIHFQKQGKMNKNKWQNPPPKKKIPEIMKQKGCWQVSFLGDALSSVFDFPNISFIIYGALERKT